MTGERTSLLGKESSKRGVLLPFILAIGCCLCAGSISLFSLYTKPFRETLDLTQYQINAIAITAELGMYFPVPFIGYFGDKHGQHTNAVVSMLLFIPSYLGAAYVYNHPRPNAHVLLSLAFGCIGTATSALYVACLSSCARMLPGSTGLAISAPVAAFGMSSLWESQLIPRLVGYNKHGVLRADIVFIFFAALYSITGIAAYSAISLSRDAPDGEPHSILESDAEAPIPHDRDHDLSQKERFILFLLNHETWILLVAFVLLSGPLEMYLNNLGALLSTVPPSGVDEFTSAHVSTFAIFSTIARLTMGIGSDWARPVVSTATILTVVAFLSGVVHSLLAAGSFLHEGSTLFQSVIPTAVSGFAYGAIFTLYPTMIAKVWGVKSFGSNWGLFVIAPAIGSLIYGLLFASVYEEYGSDLGVCLGNICYRWTFIVTGGGFIVASGLVFCLWHYSWKRASIDL